MVVKLLSPRQNMANRVENIIHIGFEGDTPVLYITNKEILSSKEECASQRVLDFKRIKQYCNYYVLTPEEIEGLKIEYL